MTDWRLPENRPGMFQAFYRFHLKHRSHPGCVYQLLPAIADSFGMDSDQRAWLTWLNGNTQNAVTSLLLLEAAPTHRDWMDAVMFWDENFKRLEWDTDRRHQKSKFGEATARWHQQTGDRPGDRWLEAASGGWDEVWRYSSGQPYMGRLSAWSMSEYARILLGPSIPDASTFMMGDKTGSASHRNGAAFVMGYDSVYWKPGEPFETPGLVESIDQYAEALLSDARAAAEAESADWAGDVTRLTLESALCTYKSWHKPNRRYPNVYSDMMYNRIRRAEAFFPEKDFGLLWETRRSYLPDYLRLEDSPYDPGLVPAKQNHYLETGEPIMMDREYPALRNSFNDAVVEGSFGTRKDPAWKK